MGPPGTRARPVLAALILTVRRATPALHRRQALLQSIVYLQSLTTEQSFHYLPSYE
jgi:hypothetical protein